MTEPENLTPAHLRCPWGQCQSIHRLADGKLLVVAQFAHMHPPGTQAGDLYEKLCDERKIGDDEAAVIISPELLDTLKAEWVREAAEALTACQAERDALKAALEPFAAIRDIGGEAYVIRYAHPGELVDLRKSDFDRARAAVVKP